MDTNKQWRLMSDEISSLRSANAELKAEVERLKRTELHDAEANSRITERWKTSVYEETRLRGLLDEIADNCNNYASHHTSNSNVVLLSQRITSIAAKGKAKG
jgi:hypothetical protein